MKKQPKMTAIALILSGISGLAYGHGYVSAVENGVAEGRVTLCKFAANGTGEKNTHCGAIQYEPQSVEGPDGFPVTGPRDGKIASAESALAAALDEQTADRWVKRPIQAGPQTFSGRSPPTTSQRIGNTTLPNQTGTQTSHCRVMHLTSIRSVSLKEIWCSHQNVSATNVSCLSAKGIRSSSPYGMLAIPQLPSTT